RLLGLVATADAGPWPQTWHAVLPLAAPAAMLAHAVAAAFADLDAAAERARLARDLSELNAIGIRLSAESNPRFLLEAILSKAREITSSDAGSLYIVEERGESPYLRFALAQNDSVAVPFRTATLPLTDESIAGHVALSGRPTRAMRSWRARSPHRPRSPSTTAASTCRSGTSSRAS